MKKIIFLSATLLAVSFGTANGQSLLDILSGRSSSSSDNTKKPPVEKINIDALKGQWKYSGAAVEFTGTDLVAMLGSSMAAPSIKQSLGTYYAHAGVLVGSCTLEFKDKGIYAARTATSSVEGSYLFDAQDQKVNITYDHPDLGGKNSLEGKLTFAAGKLTLTFEAAKIIAIIKILTKDMTLDQNVKDLIDMISEYKGLYLGFELEK